MVLKAIVEYFQLYLKNELGIASTYEQAEDLLRTMLNEQKEQTN